MRRREYLHTASLAGAATLAGCTVPLLGGPTVSNPRLELRDGIALIAFDYDIDDYRPVLLEGPDGQVVSDDQLSPSHDSDALPMGTPRGGTYTIAVKRGGDTADTAEISFDGLEASIADISTGWQMSSFRSLEARVSNLGDVPVYIEDAEFNIEGRDGSSVISEWIRVGAEESVDLSPALAISFETGGLKQGFVEMKPLRGC